MFIQRTRIPFDMLSQGRTIPTLDGTNLALIEGVNSFITVVENNDLYELHIDKQWQGNSKRTQQFMAGHIPSLVHGNPKSVCVVGLGTGQTAQRFLMHDIDELHLIEIEAELEPLLIRFFNGDWLAESSPAREKTNIELIVEDGHAILHILKKNMTSSRSKLARCLGQGSQAFIPMSFIRELANALTKAA